MTFVESERRFLYIWKRSSSCRRRILRDSVRDGALSIVSSFDFAEIVVVRSGDTSSVAILGVGTPVGDTQKLQEGSTTESGLTLLVTVLLGGVDADETAESRCERES